MLILKEKATLSYRCAFKCREQLSEESSRNSKEAVLYKTYLEEEGRQKFRKLLSEIWLVRHVSENPRTIAKALVNDLVAEIQPLQLCTGMDCEDPDQGKHRFCIEDTCKLDFDINRFPFVGNNFGFDDN